MSNAILRTGLLAMALAASACAADPAMQTQDEAAGGASAGKADGEALTLEGDDARELMGLLEDAGVDVGLASIEGGGNRFLTAYGVLCIGHHFQNQCYVSAQDVDPAWSRATLGDPIATRLWILLHHAGVVSEVSNRSDGTAGKTLLRGGTVRCTQNLDSDGRASCTIDPSAYAPRTAHHLTGADARALVKHLTDAGASVGLRTIDASTLGAEFLEAFSILCIGDHFVNTCYASAQDIEPAMSRATISGAQATDVWQLLVKAGLELTISNRSDGTNGKAVLVGGTLRCSLEIGGERADCWLGDESSL